MADHVNHMANFDRMADDEDLVQGGLDGDIEPGQISHVGKTGKVVREVGHLEQHHLDYIVRERCIKKKVKKTNKC